MTLSSFRTITIALYVLILGGFWFQILSWPQGSLTLIQEFGLFFFLGLLGALVANSTGAGGGVIFIPFFAALSFTPTQAIATSIAIQCFGMTAGTASWLKFLHTQTKYKLIDGKLVKRILIITGLPTFAGILVSQYVLPQPQLEIKTLFGFFSITFGCILFIFTLKTGRNYQGEMTSLHGLRAIAAGTTCFLGGILTAWISVGVGEAIALLLFFFGYPAFFAVAVGVFTSAVAVLTAVHFHIAANNISIEVLLFAGMAALIGGYVARFITNKLGGFNLKLFFAVWIFLSGIYTL